MGHTHALLCLFPWHPAASAKDSGILGGFLGPLLQPVSPLLMITFLLTWPVSISIYYLTATRILSKYMIFFVPHCCITFPSCSSLGAVCRGLHSQQLYPRRGSIPHLSCVDHLG